MKKKFVPYDKLSKKEKRKVDNKARKTWNGIMPATRVADTAAAYRKRGFFYSDD